MTNYNDPNKQSHINPAKYSSIQAGINKPNEKREEKRQQKNPLTPGQKQNPQTPGQKQNPKQSGFERKQ